MNSVRVLQAGLYTTVQDLGRFGYQKYGVIVSGPMDAYSLRIANLLVGNEEKEAVIEMALAGATLQFNESHVIAITGGDLTPKLDGKPVPMWRPILVKKGSVLQFRFAIKGCYAYVSFAGGIHVPKIMDSKSTYVRAGIGGYGGRTLQKGDTFACGDRSLIAEALVHQLERAPDHLSWSVNPSPLITFHNHSFIRIMKGNEFEQFDKRSKYAFFHENYTITTQSDRMGYRLTGHLLSLTEKFDMLSEAVTFGTIQVPPNGQPIILMADSQTTGGYPKIAQVISADLATLAQTRPNTSVRFQEVRLVEAEAILLEHKRILQQIAARIKWKALG
ncbi:biotin-dependent carboxyltransferase family protein [Virgibacillus sp. Bac330]|uniref:5-oxoprolinase subunit C family protein n=1 Tax=Virgibacillus sp. Bac330 TaxID=2419841 RepID=UPI000EF46CDB|nr:biotin-dependent carboxyltransferase family protein [Virgibacillus sp. Bac330]